MTSTRSHRLLLVVCLALLATTLPALASTGPWLGADKTPLPFTDEDQVLDFLRNAEVTRTKTLSQGINKSLKVTLEKDGVRAHGVFRSAEFEQKRTASKSHLSRDTFRDSYIFEVAAYELSRFLGLDRIPPTVVREHDGARGTLQLWMEKSNTEAGLIEEGKLGNAGLRHLQKQVMLVFDNLIYNFDRHQNNMLYDSNGRLWFIDHTRAFRGRPELPSRGRLAVVDGELLETLRNVDEKAMRDVLEPYLNRLESDAVIKRKRLLVKRFGQLLAERGDEGVLYDLAEVTRETAAAERARQARLAGSASGQARGDADSR